MSVGFKCPKCGSPFFTTVDMGVRPWVRQCRGPWKPIAGTRRHEYGGCDYTWTADLDRRHGIENNQDPQR